MVSFFKSKNSEIFAVNTTVKLRKDDIEKLYSKRRNTYSLADHKIVCNGKSEIEVVNKIKEIYENI